ncbi:hypothetical protein RJT34_24716 [Clitoria ternatea]|uniref:Uncharacterized protein n=1 Tax=Clitoria ternatea TaxID=43366 RepID=A0AAN9FUN4_CLITE
MTRKVTPARLSFRDKLLGSFALVAIRSRIDLLEAKLVKIEKGYRAFYMTRRLDRAYGDIAWRLDVSKAVLEHLTRMHPDHKPILLRCGGFPLRPRPRPFRFQAM